MTSPEQPLFSVLVPTYNQANYLPEALDSLINQVYSNWEAIVVNDGSTDDTQTILNSYSDRDSRIHVFNKPNGGCASALNEGLVHANGEWICWLSSDDLFQSDKLAAHLEAINQEPQIKFFYSNFYILDSNKTISKSAYISQKIPTNQQTIQFLQSNYINGISIAIHRSVIEKVGNFNENFQYSQDYDMWLRISALFEFGFIDKPLSVTRVYPEQATTAFPEAGIFESARAAVNFLNLYPFIQLFPRLDLENQVHIGKALGMVFQIIAYPNAYINICGYTNVLVDRVAEWVVQQSSTAMRPGIKQEIKRVCNQMMLEGFPLHIKRSLTRLSELVDTNFYFQPYNAMTEMGRHLREITAIDAGTAHSIRRYFDTVFMSQKISDKKSTPTLKLNIEGQKIEIPAAFDEINYLLTNSDVAEAVRTGQFSSGFEHYIRFGRQEGRHGIPMPLPTLAAPQHRDASPATIPQTSVSPGTLAPRPADVMLHLQHSDEYFRHDNLDAAQVELKKALDLVPDDAEIILAYGNLLLLSGNIETAQREFVKATVLSPEYAPAHLNLASVLLMLGKAPRAEASVRRALALNPNWPDALKLLGRLCLESGNRAEAAQAYGRVLSQNHDDVEALLALGKFSFESGDLVAARDNYKRVLRLDPGNSVASENLAGIPRGQAAGETSDRRASSWDKAHNPRQEGRFNVLLVAHEFLPFAVGGTGTYTYALAQELKQRGHAVRVLYHVVDLNHPLGVVGEDTYEGVAITRINARALPGLDQRTGLDTRVKIDMVRQFKDEQVADAFGKYIATLDLDLVHFQHMIGLSALVLQACKQQGLPSVFTLHDGWFVCQQPHFVRADGSFCAGGPETSKKCALCLIERQSNLILPTHQVFEVMVERRDFLKQALTWADTLICPSRFLEKIFATHGYQHPRQIYAPIGIRPFQPLPWQPANDQLRFTYLGHMNPTKGVDLLIEAFNLIDASKSKLDLYGVISDQAYFDQALSKSRPECQVEYHGPFTNADLPHILSQTDIAVTPSRSESYSLVVRECLFAGVPVIGPNVGGVPEIITHGQNGLLFESGNYHDLAEKLRFFVQNPEQVAVFRQHIQPILTIEQDATRLEEIYANTLASRPKQAPSPTSRTMDSHLPAISHPSDSGIEAAESRAVEPVEVSPAPQVRPQSMLPPPDFDETFYLQQYPDVAQAVRAGMIISGWEHYLRFGHIENRLAAPLVRTAPYGQWLAKHEPKAQDLDKLREASREFKYQPIISILTPVYNVDPHWLELCVESVQGQVYPHWELCLVDDGSKRAQTRAALKKLEGVDERIKIKYLPKNGGISAATNTALKEASGDFIALLDNDDELSPNALYEVVALLNTHPEADFIYSDEDKLDAGGQRCEPFFKPDWSPELLRSYAYTCHLTVIRRSLAQEIGGFRSDYDGAQDYDITLRVTEHTDRIYHIPKILYHWRKIPGSAAVVVNAKGWALQNARRALEDHVTRHKRDALGAEVRTAPNAPGCFRVRYAIRGEPLISILIPTRGQKTANGDEELLFRCIRSVVNLTDYTNYEILVAYNNELDPDIAAFFQSRPHQLLKYNLIGHFNFAKKLNWMAQQSRGEYLVIFNDDLEVIAPEWLTALLEFAQQKEIGAVGSKLLYPNGQIQHIGMVGLNALPGHWFYGALPGHPGYMGHANLIRNYSAVTGACMMVRRALFNELNGLRSKFAIDYNDVDLCMRLQQKGYRVVYTPYALLYHHESVALKRDSPDPQETELFLKLWGKVLQNDPYYNPNLTRSRVDASLDL